MGYGGTLLIVTLLIVTLSKYGVCELTKLEKKQNVSYSMCNKQTRHNRNVELNIWFGY
jgi:hypothetical protein